VHDRGQNLGKSAVAFLAVDIGNTRLKWALYDQGAPGAAMLAEGAVFLEAIDSLAEGAWRDLEVPSSMLGSVVAGEGIRRRTEEQLEIWDVEPRWVVTSAEACGVRNGYDHPIRLGVDRWVALIGARNRILAREAPRPILVVMVGTAVTVDALDTDGRFLGGLILPGFGLMLRALEMGTAGLKAPTGEAVDFPTNTSDALMSGGADAIAGAVERMHRKLLRHSGREPALIMSGGAAVKLASISDLPFEPVETLIFDGLLQLQARTTRS
jgi:type III pantothenate kinase